MNLVAAWGNNEETCRLAENVVNYCIGKLMPRMKTLDVCIQIEGNSSCSLKDQAAKLSLVYMS